MRSAIPFIGLALFVAMIGFFVIQTNGWLIQSSSVPLTANVAALFEQEQVSPEVPLPVRLTIPNIARDIPDGKVAQGTFLGVLSLATGLLSAACMDV